MKRSVFGSVSNIMLLTAKSHAESIANKLQYSLLTWVLQFLLPHEVYIKATIYIMLTYH